MRSTALLLVMAVAACGGDDGGGGGGGGGDAGSSGSDAANNTAVCDAFCGILARCNAEDPSMWDACSASRETECLAANASCAAAIDAFNTCADPKSCSNIPADCNAQMNAVTSACNW